MLVRSFCAFACGLALTLTLPLQGEGGQTLEECLTLLAEGPERRETARCFYRLAVGDAPVREALAKLDSLAAADAALPWFTYYSGHLRWYDDRELAQALYRRAAQGFARAGSVEGEILARINRSKVLSELGRNAEVAEEVDRALELIGTIEDPELRALGEVTRARQLVDHGQDLGRAYDSLRNLKIPNSMAIAPDLQKERLVLMGQAAMELGRSGHARQAFRQLVEMSEEMGNRYLEANGRANLAWVAYEELRETSAPEARAEAVRLAQEALDVAREAGHPSSEAGAAWILGILTPGGEGVSYLERCLRVAESPSRESYCLNPLAVKRAAEDPEEAQRLIARSQELASASGELMPEVLAWQERMAVDWATRPPDEALASSRKALDAIEVLRGRQAEGSPAQAGLFSIWSDEYAWLSGRVLEEAGRGMERDRAVREAFRVGERMRARALLSWLRRTKGDAAEAVSAEFVGLDEVRQALAADEALLSFQVAPWEDVAGDFGGGSWLLAVTRDGVTVHRLPDRIDVRRSVGLFEGLIARRDGSERKPSTHLYRKLLGPALEGLPPSVERLILVPDDVLHTLAFAALRSGPDTAPLGERYELVRVPSATFWLAWLETGSRREARPREHPLLVLADPELPRREGEGGEEPGSVQVAEVRGDEAGTARLAGARDGEGAGVRGVGDRLGRLPYARREGRAAVRALGGGVLLSGPEASEAALRGFDLGGVGLLHFAAHAVADEDRPERSAILLAAGGAHDGLLQGAEIAGLDLRGAAVILASCRSASGTVLRGEGVMSLGRAFFQAGAHSVVSSLWPLRDDESAAQFRRVYRHLARGATVSEALHAARREAIDRGEPAAAWAGLVLLGSGDVAPAPPSGSAGPDRYGLLIASTAGLLLVLAVIAALLRRQRIPTDRRG